jgi:FtsZ-binding cell division protein ZapB
MSKLQEEIGKSKDKEVTLCERIERLQIKVEALQTENSELKRFKDRDCKPF